MQKNKKETPEMLDKQVPPRDADWRSAAGASTKEGEHPRMGQGDSIPSGP